MAYEFLAKYFSHITSNDNSGVLYNRSYEHNYSEGHCRPVTVL